MTELIFEVREAPEGGLTARALGASVFVEADTLDELRESIRDAVRCHFDPGTEPKMLRLVMEHQPCVTARIRRGTWSRFSHPTC